MICSGDALQIKHVECFYQCMSDTRLLNICFKTEVVVYFASFLL